MNLIFSDYYATDLGEIISMKSGCVKPLKQVINKNGYKTVRLYKQGAVGTYRVHTLVLTAFVSKRPDGMVARHLNGVKTDNRLSNLKWGTVQENADDKRAHGTLLFGEKTPAAKISDAQVEVLKVAVSRGMKLSDAGSLVGVTKSCVHTIMIGKSRGDVRKDLTDEYINTIKKPRLIYAQDDIYRVIELFNCGLSQAKISEITGISQSYISRLVRGERRAGG
jgi:predicted XRE-type DNA-binding protein